MFDTNHIHPMTVHFPVAIIILAFLFDFLSFLIKKDLKLDKIAFYLQIIGTIAAVAGYLTGEFFTKEFTGIESELKETHEIFAKITMFTMIASSVFRILIIYLKREKTSLKWIYLSMNLIAAISVGYTGYLGGTLVYNYMIKF